MATFLVETFLARSTGIDLEALSHRARTAADDLSRGGEQIKYVRSILLPGEETGFHVFESSSIHVVAHAAVRAALEPARVIEAIATEAVA